MSAEPNFALLGKLTAQDISFVQTWENPVMSEFIAASAGGVMVIGAVVVIALLTWYLSLIHI